MRVLQVTAIPMTAVRFVEPLMQSLRRSGYEVELACGPGRGLQAVEAEGFPVHTVPISRNVLNWRNLHAVGATRALLRSGNFDFLHVHTPVAATVGRAAARGTGVRVFYTMHGSLWGSGASARSRARYHRDVRPDPHSPDLRAGRAAFSENELFDNASAPSPAIRLRCRSPI